MQNKSTSEIPEETLIPVSGKVDGDQETNWKHHIPFVYSPPGSHHRSPLNMGSTSSTPSDFSMALEIASITLDS